MKTIRLYQRVMGIKTEFCIMCEDCYDVAKRDNGWSVTKDGEFIDNYVYCTKWAAASSIPNHEYAPAD